MKALLMLTFIALICGCTYKPMGPDTHVPWIRRPPDQLPDMSLMGSGPKGCLGLDPNEKDECLILSASLANDIRICSVVSSQKKDSCVLALATGSSDLRICGMVSNKRSSQECKAKACEFGGYVSPLPVPKGPAGPSPDLSTPEMTFRHIVWAINHDDRVSMESLVSGPEVAQSFLGDPKDNKASMSEILYQMSPKKFRPVLVWSGFDKPEKYKVVFLTFPPDDMRSELQTIDLVLTDKGWMIGSGAPGIAPKKDPGPIVPMQCVKLS